MLCAGRFRGQGGRCQRGGSRPAEAQATAHDQPVCLVRNGSRGLFWLEPLLEVITPQGRVAYGPVSADDLPALWPVLQADAAGQAVQHPLRLGITDQLP